MNSSDKLKKLNDDLRRIELIKIQNALIINDINNFYEIILTNKVSNSNNSINFSTITVDDFLCVEEISQIELMLNRPLVERIKWDKWDYITVFIISTIGVIIDTLVGNPKKGISAACSDKNNVIGSFFDKIHKLHPSGNPMDYQGYKMSGGGHRLRSIGHDLLGFAFGIWQIMNGTFTGGYYKDGKFYEIISKVNQYGTPYETKPFIEATFSYIGHVFCDFFSTYSLPVPGFGYLAQLPSRDIRIFAADMYNNGYNLRHMFIQGFSVLFIEILTRTYCYFRYKKDESISDDQYKMKKREMLLLSHSIVSGFNIGKVVFTGDILAINLPQIYAVIYHFIPFITNYYRNNDRTQKIIRNIKDLDEGQVEKKIVNNFINSDSFNKFINSKSLIINA